MSELLANVFFDLTEEAEGLLSDLDQNITTMAVGMDEVVFHEHFEEGSSSKTSNNCIKGMSVLFEVSHWYSLHKSLN